MAPDDAGLVGMANGLLLGFDTVANGFSPKTTCFLCVFRAALLAFSSRRRVLFRLTRTGSSEVAMFCSLVLMSVPLGAAVKFGGPLL